jgi:hypothetical protein
MESVDMFNAATAPLTFHDFLDRMRHPLAADFVRSIKTSVSLSPFHLCKELLTYGSVMLGLQIRVSSFLLIQVSL